MQRRETLQQAWDTYRDNLLFLEKDPVRLNQYRSAFYSGVMVALRMCGLLIDDPDGSDMELDIVATSRIRDPQGIAARHRELANFFDDELREAVKEAEEESALYNRGTGKPQ